MAREGIAEMIARQTWLDPAGDVLQQGVAAVYTSTGRTGQIIKNLLSGTWLGHPLHPAITDVPVGSWTASLTCDLMEGATGRREWATAADATVMVGLVGAVGAALSGLSDWHHTVEKPRRIGLAHGLLNLGAASLYTTSYVLRRRGARAWGRRLAYFAYATAVFSAWVGGDLVYDQHIGPNQAPTQEPEGFVPVCDESDLQESMPRRVDVNGIPVMVVRQQGAVYALGEICSHLGGPLAEGAVRDGIVTCPWHGSQFALADGHVVNGPATFPQPCYQTRVRNGKLEVGPFCEGAKIQVREPEAQPTAQTAQTA